MRLITKSIFVPLSFLFRSLTGVPVSLHVNVPADTESLNCLIKACLAGGALKHALEIFEWMASSKRASEPLPANIETYNTLIKACHQVRIHCLVGSRPERLKALSKVTFTRSPSLFCAQPQAGQLEKALEIMAWVQHSGVQFNDTTYEELIAVTEIAEVRCSPTFTKSNVTFPTSFST